MESKEEVTVHKKGTFLKKTAKVFLWIIASVLFLFALALILIQTSFVQNFARKKVVSFLENKLKTTVQIGKLDVDFPTSLSLQKVFFADQTKDTLLYGGELKVDIDMVGLLSNDIRIQEIALNNMYLNVKRLPPDSVFNFQFIVDAFAGEQKKEPSKEDTATLKMDIDRILVNKTRIVYRDAFTGNDMDVAIGHLDTKISTFDPSHLLFNIPTITLKGLKGHFYQAEPLKKTIEKTVAEAAAAPDHFLKFFNKEMDFSDIDMVYNSEPAQLNSSFVIQHILLHPKTMDLKNSIITLNDVTLTNGNIVIGMNSKIPDQKPADSVITTPEPPPFKIIADNIEINNANLKVDDKALPHIPSGMDYGHLDIRDLSLNATSVQYNIDTTVATIKSAKMTEKSGFVLNNFTGNFYMIPTGVFLKDFYIETPGTELKNTAIITYASLPAIQKDMGELGLYINLENSKIAMKDLWIFAPQLKAQTASLSPTSTLYIDAKINGKVSDLNFERLSVKGLTATNINLHGRIKGLPDPNRFYADLDIKTFQTSRRDILSFLPKKSLPANITLPTALAASGTFRGGMNNMTTDLTVNSTLGGAKVRGSLANITNENTARYNLAVNARNLQLGTLMQNPKLGSLNADVQVKGHGYNPATANAVFNGVIGNIGLNNYNYRNIRANGSIANKSYKINADINDPNVDATITANGLFSGKFPTVNLVASIDSIKTLPLHLTPQEVKYHGDIQANFTNIDPDNLQGNLFVTHSVLVNDGQRVNIDSLQVTAENSPGNQSLQVQTPFLSASIKGQYKLTQLADVFQQAIDPYFSISKKKTVSKVDPYRFSINASAVDNPALRAFLPDIKEMEPVFLAGNFASDSGWNMYAKAPRIVYGTYVIDSLNLDAGTRNGAVAFRTFLGQFSSGNSLKVYGTTLAGTLQNNILAFALNIKDKDAKSKYNLAGSLNVPNLDHYIFSVDPKDLLLNYETWTVNNGNKIEYQNKGIIARNFVLSQAGQQLSINSADATVNSPLQINFENFQIATLTGFVQSDSLLVNGVLNGSATVKNLQTQPTFTTDLTVNDLSIYKDTIGNLRARVNNNIANTYHADVNLTGFGNDVSLAGDYNVKPKNSSYDLVLNIKQLQMKVLEGLSNGAIKDARGFIYGNVAMNGSVDNPNIDGRIQFENTAFNATTLNNVFKVDKEAIAIVNNEGIKFSTFTIRDTADNAVVIDGMLNTADFFNYTFDLKIKANNFQVINSTVKDNDIFYGRMIFSTNLTVKGSPEHPVVDGDLSINDKTDFTFVLPQAKPGVEQRKGIVRFVDMSATQEDSLFMAPYDSLKTSKLTGYDVSLNISIDKDATFNMIVDAANGDFLRLKGVGQMTAGIDASGKITLVGSYDIDQGTYNLSFNFLKRKFDIQKGSRIVWTGEPTTAQIDVTAIYIANTAPLDLVQGQIQPANENIYKQKLPFEVHLRLLGELLKPVITFDILLPEDRNYNVSKDIITTVQTKLTQMRDEPSEMNKQVFALLLLNRFVGENPFDNSSGGSLDAGTFAMQSVSRLLSEQLNQLTANLIQGVDINFDLATTQDFTTGSAQNRTDLNVGISKRLLSDRLTVSVGSNFELQGPMQTHQQPNNIAGNIAVNYQLSKDGRYMLRAYRKNDYTGAIEGYVIETGLSFIVSVDYNKFSQIFTTKEQRRKKRQIKKQNKEIKKADDIRLEQQERITPPSKAKENEK